MTALRRLSMVASSQPSAWTARERLLHDRQMRCTRSGAALFSEPIQPQAPTPRKLSLAEQQRQAIQIARTFDRHYLAAIHYADQDEVVTAIVRPVQRRDTRREVAYEIGVDAAGNVNVTRGEPASVQHRAWVWMSMLTVSAALLAGCVLVIL